MRNGRWVTHLSLGHVYVRDRIFSSGRQTFIRVDSTLFIIFCLIFAHITVTCGAFLPYSLLCFRAFILQKKFRDKKGKVLNNWSSMIWQNWKPKSSILCTFYWLWYCTSHGNFKRTGERTDSWLFGWHLWFARFREQLSDSRRRGGKIPGIAWVLKGWS